MSLVILSNEYRGAAFDLTRGKIRDQFSNPQCGNGTFVSALCERYNAVCKTSRCKYCVCNDNDNRTTYFRNNNSAHGQCTRDFVIAKDSGEYMQFMLYFDYLLFFIIICYGHSCANHYVEVESDHPRQKVCTCSVSWSRHSVIAYHRYID